MQSQCSCPKWYDALDLDAVYALIDKYEAHPVYSKGFRACLKSTFVGCDQRTFYSMSAKKKGLMRPLSSGDDRTCHREIERK